MLLFWIIIPEAYYNNSVILPKKNKSPGGDSNARSQDFSVEITVLRLKPTWLPRVSCTWCSMDENWV